MAGNGRGIPFCRDLTTGFDHVGTHRHPLSPVLLGTSARDAEVCRLALIAVHHGKWETNSGRFHVGRLSNRCGGLVHDWTTADHPTTPTNQLTGPL
jgi:hypothetical protein